MIAGSLDERETAKDSLAGGMSLEQYAQWLWSRQHDVEFDISQDAARSDSIDRDAPTMRPSK